MLFRASLASLHAHRVYDHPWDPFNRGSEFYQTWQLHAAPVGAADPADAGVLTGFSLGGGLHGGVRFSDDERVEVDDPDVAMSVDVSAGARERWYRWTVFQWESDGSTRTVKSLFTSPALKLVARALDATDGGLEHVARVVAQQAGLLERAADVALHGPPRWARLPLSLGIPTLEAVVALAARNADDLIGATAIDLGFRRRDAALEWRVVGPGAPDEESGWRTDEDTVVLERRLEDAAQHAQLTASFRFRLLA
jgi:hypothetical protein